MAFIEELFELIVKRLRKTKYSDGTVKESKQTHDIFDYEGSIGSMTNPVIVELRSQNLKKFLIDIVENVLMINIDLDKRKKKLNDCKQNFTEETILLTLKAH